MHNGTVSVGILEFGFVAVNIVGGAMAQIQISF
jgi:hypothetical protein